MNAPNLSDGHLIISVKEARKLLGKEYASMSDEQIEDLIIQLHGIAKASLKMAHERITATEL